MFGWLNKILAGVGAILGVLALIFRGRYLKEKAAREKVQLEGERRKAAKERKASQAVLDGVNEQQEEIDRVKKNPVNRGYFDRSDY